MRYLHTMIRAADLDKTLSFFVDHLGLVEVRRYDSEQGRFTSSMGGSGGDAAPSKAVRRRRRSSSSKVMMATDDVSLLSPSLPLSPFYPFRRLPGYWGCYLKSSMCMLER